MTSAHPEAEPRSRAGRNLPQAVAVGVGLGALVLAALFVRKVAFVVLACVALLIAVRELATALSGAGIRVPQVPLALGTVAMLVAAYAGGGEPLLVALLLTTLALLVWPLGQPREGYLRDVGAGVFVAVYGPFLAGSAMLMLRPEDGPRRVVVFVLLVVCNDVGGYAVGVLLGRHPMAPTVSPKKSWEGFTGSLVAGCAGGALALELLLDAHWWQGVLVGVVAVCAATLGDLGESLLKRDLKIKDMGALLPGHGGLFDRLDSLLPTAPAVYLLLHLFVPG